MPLVVPYRSAISLRTSTWTATGEDHNARAARFSAAAEGAPAGRALPRELTYSTRSQSASAGSGVRARSRRSGGRAAQCVREGVRPLEVVAVPSTSGENGRPGRCVVAFRARMTRSPCFVFAGSSAPGVNCERHQRRSRAHRA